MPVCPNCGNQAAENAIFCDQCGTRLPVVEAEPAAPTVVAEAEVESATGGVPEGVLICPNCGAENVPGEVFCDVCGEPLEAPEPVPSAAVPAGDEAEVVPEVELEPVFDTEPALEVETVLEVAEEEGEPAAPEPVAAEATGAAQVYCPVCGASVHPGDTFCGTCGASLTAAAEEQSLVEEPVVVEAPEEAVAEGTGEPVLVEESVQETVVEEPAVVEGEAEEVPGAAVPEVEEAVVEAEAEEAVPEGAVEEAVVEEPLVVEAEAEPVEETVLEEPIVVEEAVEEAVVEEPVVAEAGAEPAEAEELHCPVCGAIVLPEQRFCASCGAALPAAQGAVAPQPVAESAVPEEAVAEAAVPEEAVAVPEPVAPVETGPYLEVADSGAHIPLIEQPELLIGRTDDVSGIYPDVDMTPHGGEEGGVSRRHALLVHDQGAWYVVDLDSTNGTYVNGNEVAPQVRVPLEDGDRISFGDAEVVLHIL